MPDENRMGVQKSLQIPEGWPVEGVTIPWISVSIVRLLHFLGLLMILKKWAPTFTARLIWYVLGGIPLLRKISPGSWYLWHVLGREDTLKNIQHETSRDIKQIVEFLAKPGVIPAIYTMTPAGVVRLVHMVCDSNGTEEFKHKSGDEITMIARVLLSQSTMAEKAWPGLHSKKFDEAIGKKA